MVEEKKASAEEKVEDVDQEGEDKDEMRERTKSEAIERTREVSMPDAYYKSLLLENFLSGIDEFAEE